MPIAGSTAPRSSPSGSIRSMPLPGCSPRWPPYPMSWPSLFPMSRSSTSTNAALCLPCPPYCHTDHYWQVYFDTNKLIARTFGEAGYSPPFVIEQQKDRRVIAHRQRFREGQAIRCSPLIHRIICARRCGGSMRFARRWRASVAYPIRCSPLIQRTVPERSAHHHAFGGHVDFAGGLAAPFHPRPAASLRSRRSLRKCNHPLARSSSL